ncbi:hypothetical protein U8527_20910 [Kordia algicida OT-1]|uniref:Uncharacterized protein n=1 Tax=Kordia algicida OT-1 TaxID=391587 RepID=A9DL32_9FLAO|nr:hypothetical protein [Kordia algicida]EDP98466.1 hypothetical protein KAOT1_14652 [Kordia algicida OT-1]
MIKNILNVDGVKTLTKTEQHTVLGGINYKLVCKDGVALGGILDNCHCNNLSDGLYIVQFPDDGTAGYTTYNILGRVVEEL